MEKEIKDIEDINAEFKKLNDEIYFLEHRLVAVGLDYMHFINSDIKQDFLMELRDNIMYRLFSSKFHIELLFMQLNRINAKILHYLQNEREEFLRDYQPTHPYFENFQREISSIFDSFVYHTVSIFDYLSSLIYFVCFQKQEPSFKWNNVVRSCRDKNNVFSQRTISKLILLSHQDFVSKLYEYRSLLIHQKGDLINYNFSSNFFRNDNFNIKFYSTKQFLKFFPELKNKSDVYKFSIPYSIFWVQNKTLRIINEILFSLKAEMESNPKIPHGVFVFIDKDTNEISSASKMYWYEKEYYK